jgi:hypothetical protein
MDRHYLEGATRHALANAHSKDLANQSKNGVRFITYWCDEERSTAFCLVDAPNNRNAEILLHLRIVLSVGEFVEDDNDLFGATVQLASRLCEHATADQILAAEDVVKQSPNQKFRFSASVRSRPKASIFPSRFTRSFGAIVNPDDRSSVKRPTAYHA